MKFHKFAVIIISILLYTSLVYAERYLSVLTTSQIVKKYAPSVVTIVALDQNDQPLSLGSGFFINTEGDIATNYHILESSAKAIIKTVEGKKGDILEIINYDPELDLLIAKTSLKNTTPIPLWDSDTITVGEEIVAIGNPAGLEGTVSKGIISGVRKVGGFKFIQITAPISPGSSGGPVFNSLGHVIGVATAYLDIGQNLNFAMPVNYLKSLKPNRIKLSSLPKMTPKSGSAEKEKYIFEKDDTLVRGFDVHYRYHMDDLSDIYFAIKNLSNHPIRNIKILFVYKNIMGEVISYSAVEIEDLILPKLALQFTHRHYVNYFRKWDDKYRIFKEGVVEIRILDYLIDRTGRTSPADLLFK